MGDVIPFQDIFTSFFFVSIGMLLDLNFFMEYPISIIILTLGIFILKSFVVTVTALFLKLPIRTSVLSGMALSQVGEFSFVLAMSGISYHIGNEYLMGLFLAVAVLTMGLTPTLIALSPFVANLVLKLPLPLRIKSGMETAEFNTKINCNNHAIIIGYGFSGRNLSRSCKEALVPYTIVDMNPETVSQEKLKGEPIYYGDATRDHVLIHANIRDAKVIAIVVNDPIGAMRVVERARSLNPSIYIVVRTRYLQEMRILFQLGADDVIPDELGSSVEIFTRVLTKYKIPSDHIEQLVSVLRTEGYEMIRPRYSETTLFSDLNENLNEIAVKTLVIGEKSSFVDRSLIQTEMRKKYGLTVLVIKRKNDTIYNVDPETILKTGDKVVVVGDKQHLAAAHKLFG